MTRRTKSLLGSLVVLALCLAGVGAVVLHQRGSKTVAISDKGLTAAGLPSTTAGVPPTTASVTPVVAGATTPAASASPSPSASASTSPAAPLTKKAKKKAAKKAKAKAKAKTAKKAKKAKKAKSAPKPPASIPAGKISAKKGASVWAEDGITKSLADSGVSWMYNWAASPNGVTAPKGVQYVPMIWGAKSADAATLAKAKANGNTLLGFNEPDFADQSNMSVDQALDLWPKLEATGMRLGSPAVAWGADQDGKWLDKFMTGAKQRGYRVDFITLHWYGGDFNPSNATNQLRTYIQNTYAKYHKPIWVTEYALMNFGGGARLPSAGVQAEFVTKSTAMLQSLSYVERYAWFAFPTSTDGTDGTGLYRPGGAITPPGKAYRAAG